MKGNTKFELKALGSKSIIPKQPSIDTLETFQSPSNELFYVTFTQHNEFTSKCPKTGQPDYGTIKILYSPNKRCLESKSLKLYLASYRNVGSFGETITNRIADDLYKKLTPRFLVVIGDFKPRGGIGWSTEAYRVDSYANLFKIDLIQIQKFNVRTVEE